MNIYTIGKEVHRLGPKDGLITKIYGIECTNFSQVIMLKITAAETTIGLHWIIWKRYVFVDCCKLRK